MEVTLVYRGTLPASQGDDKHTDAKQRIRKCFSEQLRNLWEVDPHLRIVVGEQRFAEAILEKRRLQPLKLDRAYAFARVLVCGYRTLAIANTFNGIVCHLHVALFRREDPGAVVHGGDLDNRLKTLLDALRMPQAESEVPGNMWGKNEEMLYCLLEDDSLISRLSIETRRLRTPAAAGEGTDYAELVVDVTFKVLRPHMGTAGVFGP